MSLVSREDFQEKPRKPNLIQTVKQKWAKGRAKVTR